jgi:SNF2 family DNA or RNA helicase
MISNSFIEIKHLKDENSMLIFGAYKELLENRRSKLFLREHLKYSEELDGLKVLIVEDISKTVDLIKKAANYIAVNVRFSGEITNELNNHIREEQEFELYSNNALQIRNNNCNEKDFLEFKNSVEKKITGRVLYPLQFLSAFHLAFAQNACNFSVPGAGKTSVVYGAFSYLNSLNSIDSKYVERILIIGPLSSFGPWENEFMECFNRKPHSIRLSGAISLEQKKLILYSSNPPEILLLSYASLIAIKDDLKYYLKMNKCMVVLDEAHKIKNINNGVIASSVLEISNYCSSRVILTGTPAPNGYEDLFNLFKFIWPKKRIINYSKGQLKDMSLTPNDPRVDQLIDSISPFFIRVRKSDLNIPPAIELRPVIFKMSELQRKVYDFIESKFVSDIINSRERAIYSTLTRSRLIRLMQLASNPLLLMEPITDIDEFKLNPELSDDLNYLGNLKSLCNDELPIKFIEAEKIVNEVIHKGEKIIIWCCFTKTILGLSEYFNKKGIKSKILFGATPIEKEGMNEDIIEEETRERIIREFHSPDSDFKVIIANSYAVSESISLHKACHNALYLERTFNASIYIQSKDRIHRYGLDSSIVTKYYYLIAENSIEGTIHRLLKEKEERLLQLIESMPIPLFNLVADDNSSDISEILRDYARRVKA